MGKDEGCEGGVEMMGDPASDSRLEFHVTLPHSKMFCLTLSLRIKHCAQINVMKELDH